jgi:hypothetical protein
MHAARHYFTRKALADSSFQAAFGGGGGTGVRVREALSGIERVLDWSTASAQLWKIREADPSPAEQPLVMIKITDLDAALKRRTTRTTDQTRVSAPRVKASFTRCAYLFHTTDIDMTLRWKSVAKKVLSCIRQRGSF